ncbi:RagB/SusD family nutrient uptake outer membrane protein [Algoriphagus sp.]|uniref:RagB/SusD family nutrient uptake outer membrane protein n=1 Tax=Algoriphagus sp. TaxID=1872435 RepID=UPI0027194877|nr:RagB/SusD family nutrient uptake outer membrane protein [Algoriphagus sp.]MDO8967075.1 RagB/SusD family nutrient uptake outer membrane protein [Algoriphagus sp.]MDP3199431.1 RagB/SusD family nutrient uptake outer membrane protein [Algoriphagus sp.]
MKTIYRLLSFVLLLFISISCGDEFLTKEPQGQFSSSVLATEAGVEGLLLGSYKMLSGTGLDGQAPWENDVQNWVFGGIASDDAYKGTDAGDQPEQSFIEAYDFQAFNGHIRNKWRGLYKGVARANDAINTLKKVERINDATRTRIIAEARFLRGFFHMEARKMWRRPPYISDEVFNIDDVESTKVPNDVEIWPFIEADLKAAMDNLPETQAQVGRPTKWAAMAMLAKAKMYQGWDASGNANAAKLTEAKALLDQIVNSGRYRLVDRYADNFKVTTRNNAESIFEIQYAINSANDQASNQGVGLAHPYTDPWGCCGFYQASQNLVNAFKTSPAGLPLLDNFNDSDVTWQTEFTGFLDPRIDHSLGRPGILFKDFKIHGTDFIRDVSYAGPYSSMKHVAERAGFGIGGWQNLTSNNYRILRYSMVLLWLAEAEVEIGSLERARELVNMVRTRAANPAGFVPKAIQGSSRNDFTIVSGTPAANYNIKNYTTPWADKSLARKAVRFETRLEFSMEGHRFFDLQRWGVAADVLNKYLQVEGTKRVYLSGRTFTKNKNEFFPIPLEAIDRSLKDGQPTLAQDPNY